GSGENQVPCVTAEDLAAAIVAALELGEPGEQVFLVADPAGPTQADLWRWHAEAAGLPVPRGRLSERAALLAAVLLEGVAAGTRRPPLFHRFDVMVLSRDVRVDAHRARRMLVWRPRGLYPEAIRSAVREHGMRGSRRI
ncbi:MAG TPA: hypothetical protein VMS88_00940, partial [Terriglobales bacterium]|nr:hypothetical protein [Terriglobales bacterium]